MFWDNIDSSLFKPLASANSKIYSIALNALYDQLVSNQVEVGECTPTDAKATIRKSLLEYGQQIDWSLEEDEKVFQDEPDEAGRIYRRLRECGWLREIDGVGYRRETFMPRIASNLIDSLRKISIGPVSKLGAKCQGIYTSIRSVSSDINNGANSIDFAADTARTFYAELSAITASCQEVAYLMREEHSGSKLFTTFFDDFLKGILLADFSKLSQASHPYRYRAVTIDEIFNIFNTPSLIEQMSIKHQKEHETATVAISREIIEKDLHDITKIFEGIDVLLKRIDHYRSTMTRRTREAIQYALSAVPELGKRIDNLVGDICQFPTTTDNLPNLHVTENYVSVQRLYKPKTISPPAQANTVDKKSPSVEAITRSRAVDAYIRKRAPNPKRIVRMIETAMKDKQSITTDDITIENLDDFLAYLQMRDLLHDAVPLSSPFRPLIKLYKLIPIIGEFTENEYLRAPKIYIERRIQPKALRTSNVT